jgi:hypothetical protein
MILWCTVQLHSDIPAVGPKAGQHQVFSTVLRTIQPIAESTPNAGDGCIFQRQRHLHEDSREGIVFFKGHTSNILTIFKSDI